jgi:hypothetical protein
VILARNEWLPFVAERKNEIKRSSLNESSIIASQTGGNRQLIWSWKDTKGVFNINGWQSKSVSPDHVKTIVHGMIITNIKTRMMYLCWYESSESKWEEAWKIGEKMIQTIMLNEGI